MCSRIRSQLLPDGNTPPSNVEIASLYRALFSSSSFSSTLQVNFQLALTTRREQRKYSPKLSRINSSLGPRRCNSPRQFRRPPYANGQAITESGERA